MSKYEKLGSFLLFEKTEEDKFSKNFLAGRIVNNQIQSIHVVKKFDHSLSTSPDFILDQNQEFEILKQLANPGIICPSQLIQEKSEFAAVVDYLEGKSLRSVLTKCAQEGYPFTADHALLIASRICTALEYIHSKKVNDERLVHGFICPENIFVSYDGEVKLLYLGLARTLIKFPAGRDKFFHEHRSYLAPESLSQQKLDKAIDIYGAGVVLYEMLTGGTVPARGSISQVLDQAQMHNNSGERIPIGDEIKKVLSASLAADPAQRYPSVADMRKALDKFLFTSEFAPTTFNLAFFMNSLFRESIDEESKSITNFKKIDVTAFVKEEPPPPPKPEHPVGAEAAKDIPPLSIGMERGARAPLAQPEVFGAGEAKEKSKAPLFIGVLIAVAVLGTGAYFFLKPSKTEQPATTTAALTLEQQKAQDAERQRLQDEASKAQDEAKKKDEALKELQAKMDALLKAQQDAKKAAAAGTAPLTRAIDTQQAIQKLQEEAKRLEEEKKQQQAIADEKLKAAQAPPTVTTPSPSQAQPDGGAGEAKSPQLTSTTQPQGGTPASVNPTENPATENKSAQPALASSGVTEGQEVELTPDVVRPEITSRFNPTYPPAAQAKRIEGTVILSILVSEKGDVADVKVLRGAGGRSGLDEAASAAVKKWKFRPAVKDGKRVRVWVTYPIVFKLQ